MCRISNAQSIEDPAHFLINSIIYFNLSKKYDKINVMFHLISIGGD